MTISTRELSIKHKKALNRFMEKRGLNTLSWCKRAGIGESTLRSFINNEEGSSITLKTLAKLAAVENVTVSEILGESEAAWVKLVGYVGAGAEIFPLETHGDEEIDRVEAPPGVDPTSIVAVKVTGDSMYPVYKEGDIIYYTRLCDFHDSCLKQECVIKLRDGRAFVKVLSRGSVANTFTLISYNSPPIEDVEIEWACEILWVRKARR